MPGSCDSDNASPNLISSLRNFRFARETKRYQPPGQASPASSQSSIAEKELNTPQKPDSTSFKESSNGSSNKITSPSEPVNTQNSSPSACQQYGPLSYRKYDSIASNQYLITCIINKFQQVLKKTKSLSNELELKVSNEELKKIKELSLTVSSVSQKWKCYVTHEDHSFNSVREKVLRVNRGYLKELLKLVKNDYRNSLTSRIVEQSETEPTAVRTYSRPKPTTPPAAKPVAETVANVGTDLSTGEEKKPKEIMDDYEVFCSKEQSLRRLLDAFPGADIMEAQDILVKCNWNLRNAMGIAAKLPLRCSKKKALFSNSEQSPQAISSTRTSTTSSTAEEIVLDSSDDEDMNKLKPVTVNNKKSHPNSSDVPPAKRRRVSSSDTDEDDPPPQKTSNSVTPPSVAKPSPSNVTPIVTKPSAAAKTLTVASTPTVANTSTAAKPTITTKLTTTDKPTTANKPSDPVIPSTIVKSVTVTKPLNPAQNSASVSIQPSTSSTNNNGRAFSMSQSVSVKPVPVASTSKAAKHDTSRNSMPNLPKGLVITQVGNSPVDDNSTDMSNDSSNSSTSTTKPETVSLPAGTRIITTDSLKKNSPQLVHIKSSNGVSTKPSDSDSSSLTSQSKSLSIIPKGVSITPVGHSSASSSANSSNDASQKPKSSKGKRKKDEMDDEDDEDYGDDLIYDSDASDFEEESLTPAHGAVLKYFQDSTPDELLCIPGCSKKKVDALLSVRPFVNWKDLVVKLSTDKYLSTEMLNGAKKVLDMRSAINKLMTRCQQISLEMEDLVENLKENKESSSGYVNEQPALLNDRMHLTSYQMLGLNWMLLMRNQEVNGILADEMGLGKTVQAIAFLAYLKQINTLSGPHLIVVPSSVLDNWKQEFKTWWPDVSMIWYHGSQDSRRDLRMQILNDEVDEFDVMVTTYNMVTSSSEDRGFFKRLEFDYVVFDEAHMLKNMASQRYQHLMKIKAPRRLLLTGTPLQNNLVELMSLLIFAMPNMFSGKTEHIRHMFSSVSKIEGNKNTYEKDRIEHAKMIMKPFVLRRLKKDVLQDLPPKHDETKLCPMTEDQAQKYEDLVATFSAEVQSNQEKDTSSSGAGMMMQLRRAANHPLLLKRFYNDGKLRKMSKAILKEPTHTQSDPNLVFEDMSVMSDFELHKLCKKYKSLKSHALSDKEVLNSGKFNYLDSLLPSLFKEGHRVLLFSQFTMVLDIVEDYMNIRKYKFLRLDGQVPVAERQQLIDQFNSDPEIAVFLLSTRAGGLGINLTAADTVVLHDVDFNPYNDKQAEDRCHRVGQTKDVSVYRLISENTIEEGILQRATEKLKLEREIHEEDENETEENDVASVAKLLRDALGLKSAKS